MSERKFSRSRVDLDSATNVGEAGHDNYEYDAYEEPLRGTQPNPGSKIDINALNSEILTDGMQVSTAILHAYVATCMLDNNIVSYSYCTLSTQKHMHACKHEPAQRLRR